MVLGMSRCPASVDQTAVPIAPIAATRRLDCCADHRTAIVCGDSPPPPYTCPRVPPHSQPNTVTSVTTLAPEECLTDSSAPALDSMRINVRLDHEPPPVATELGWRYHHIGIPTNTVRAGEVYLKQFGMFVTGFSTSPFGIEWMRFESDSPVHELIRTVPHVAFEVDDLDVALIGRQVIHPAGSPSDGVRAAMIVHDGAPVELIWFRKSEVA